MAIYQVPKDSKGYKNPKTETPGSFTKMPTSPLQTSGLMGAAAKAKALKPGIPPLPTLAPAHEEPGQTDARAAEKTPAERPTQAPITINVGGAGAQPDPRSQAAAAIAQQGTGAPAGVTGGIPAGGIPGYMTDMKASGMGQQAGALKVGDEVGTEEGDPAPGQEGTEYDAPLGGPPAAEEEGGYQDIDTGGLKEAKANTEKYLFDIMNSSLGLSETEIQNQVEQIKMSSAEEQEALVQQMAARGLGASGLTAAGLGQIQASSMAAMANVRFEAARVKIEDRLNRFKSYMAMYGNILGDEVRVAMQNEINRLTNNAAEYAKHQDRIADSWQSIANWAASHSAKGYADGALSKVMNMLKTINPNTGEYYSWEEVVENLTVYPAMEDGVKVYYVQWKPGLKQPPLSKDYA